MQMQEPFLGSELVELTTWPRHPHTFYHVTNEALTFDVKAVGNAAIGLAKRPGSYCDYWITIGENNRCWIRTNADRNVEAMATTPNVINDSEYRRFWLGWFGGRIQLGIGSGTTPVVTQVSDSTELYYITFAATGELRVPVHWKFKLPAPLVQPKLTPIPDGKLHWVQATNYLPEEALIGGFEKENLYIMRAPHAGSLTPGKLVRSQWIGYVGWTWEAHPKHEFEVLCGYDCYWMPSQEGKVPVGAVEGGYSENDFCEKLYVGRAEHQGFLIPGKVQRSHGVCFITYDGKEIGKKAYEVLIDPNYNPHCVNKTIGMYAPTFRDRDRAIYRAHPIDF